MIHIKTLYCDDLTELAYEVRDAYARVIRDDICNSVTVIAKYYDAKEIICELVMMGYSIATMDDFSDPEYDKYDDAYVISLYRDEIWCQPVMVNDRYIFIEDDVVFIMEDCNSKILERTSTEDLIAVELGDEECDCENYEETTSDKTLEKTVVDDVDMHGFTVSKNSGDSYVTYSFYSSEKVSNDDMAKLLKCFGL